MQKIILIIILSILFQTVAAQQKYFTNKGYISFFSHTAVEDIKAVNSQVLSIIDFESGEIAISILMKSFNFEKALMQEHFNENYVESNKYPKAIFSGKILNYENILNREQSIAEIQGELTIKDVTKEVFLESKVQWETDKITLKGKFLVTVADYNIKIPAIVRRNIAEKVEVAYNLIHEPYK